MNDMNRFIDHTLLRPDARQEEIEKLCKEAVRYSFFSVCVNPYNIPFAVPILDGSEVKICTVIGFPLGADLPGMKATEAKDACLLGANEVDMVINIGALKDKKYDTVRQDILSVVHVAKANNALTKVILETAVLSDEEIVKACHISKECGADFVKTSTGFAKEGGATLHAVSLMKREVGHSMGVKASGGIKDRKTAEAMIAAGATRLGTSSSIDIATL
jgi:deoxyribose-phosphate aldolase